MNEFNIVPGPKVGLFLEKARNLYSVNPCSREELLEKLRFELDKDEDI